MGHGYTAQETYGGDTRASAIIGGPEMERTPGKEMAANEVNWALDRLEKQLSLLTERLQPVLTASQSDDAERAMYATDEMSEMRSRLMGSVRRINNLTDFVMDLTGRIDL